MRKFNITIGSSAGRSVNANEYNVFPKTNLFKTFEGGDAASTSGKGKSAINNHYLYAKHEGVIFYFKSDAAEIAAARADGFSFLPADAVDHPGAALVAQQPDEPAAQEPTPAAAPKARRTRVSKV